MKQLFDFKTESIPDLPIGRMMEIGCASGAFLHRMQSKGWKVWGIEPSPSAAKNAVDLGFPVHVGPAETAPAPDEPFDLGVGWMVLEHLHSPLDTLKTLNQWIRPGGWLALSVPNAGSIEFKLFKEHWYALHVPNHLYHFTPETLRRMLTEAGWQVKRIFYQRSLSNVVGSIGIGLKEKELWSGVARRMVAFPEKTWLSSYLLYPAALLASYFGQTGRMTVWANKIDNSIK